MPPLSLWPLLRRQDQASCHLRCGLRAQGQPGQWCTADPHSRKWWGASGTAQQATREEGMVARAAAHQRAQRARIVRHAPAHLEARRSHRGHAVADAARGRVLGAHRGGDHEEGVDHGRVQDVRRAAIEQQPARMHTAHAVSGWEAGASMVARFEGAGITPVRWTQPSRQWRASIFSTAEERSAAKDERSRFHLTS